MCAVISGSMEMNIQYIWRMSLSPSYAKINIPIGIHEILFKLHAIHIDEHVNESVNSINISSSRKSIYFYHVWWIDIHISLRYEATTNAISSIHSNSITFATWNMMESMPAYQ